MKKFIFLLIMLTVLLFALIIYSFFSSPPTPPQKQSSITPVPVSTMPIPTTTPTEVPTFLRQVAPLPSEYNALMKQDVQKGKMLDILPYEGVYFSFDFDTTKNSYVLTLDKNHITQGNNNFNNFLSSNGIQDRSWFNDLITIYQ